ncbi:MAG: FAD-binding oxidoreductase [Rhodospirillales bacterium]
MTARRPVAPEVVARLKTLVGPSGWIEQPEDVAPYCRSWRDDWEGRVPLVVRPASTEELAAVVRLCAETGTPIVPQGGNTGLTGASQPHPDMSEVIVSTSRLKAVRAVDTLNDTITVEAGVVLADIQRIAAEHDRLFPLSLGAEGSCQIGGNLSTNAGGTQVIRYGNTRNLVLGLEVVLPDGRTWNGLRGLRKDNTGYDLKQLFVGGEGTLGIVTAVVLKLFPAVGARAAAWAGVADPEAAVALLGHLQARCGDRLSTFEAMSRGQLDLVLAHVPGTRDPLGTPHPWSVLVEVTEGVGGPDPAERLEAALAGAFDDGLVADAAVAATEAQVAAFWRLRDSVSEANRNAGYSVSHDTSVPIPAVPEFVRRATAALEARPSRPRVVAVGHVGDGNIHLVAIFDRTGRSAAELRDEADAAGAEVHRIAADLGGSISAEHGIGSAKRDELALHKAPLELELMRGIKRLFDPHDLMNPGKVLPPGDAAPDPAP